MGQHQDHLQNHFTAGEISPRLYARSDLGKYYNGVAKMLNHTVWAHGGSPRRMGSRHVAEACHYHDQGRLIPFQFSTEQAYILEFGQFKMRVFKDRGQVLNPDDTVFEIYAPWAAHTLDLLSFTQSADVMYFAHPYVAPQKLTRAGHDDWTLEWVSFINNPFSGVGKFPSSVAFFEQRLVFAGTGEKPQTLWFSRTDDYENFVMGSQADDAIEFTIAADQVNAIRWLSPGRQLAIGTVGGEWICEGANGQPISPDTITVRRHSRTGSAAIAPVRIGGGAIFVQAAGRKLYELAYDFNADAHLAADLSELSEHITQGGLRALAYQQEPDSILWMVRQDGVLLGFTFSKRQDVMAWHRHILGGSHPDGPLLDESDRYGERGASIDSVACIPRPDGLADDVWLLVRRVINGEKYRSVEYLESAFEPQSPRDKNGMVYLDCCAEYQGLPREGKITAHPSDQSVGVLSKKTGVPFPYAEGEVVRVRFGKTGHLLYGVFDTPSWLGSKLDCLIFDDPLPPEIGEFAPVTLSRTVTRVTGLDHLEGARVSVLADHAAHPDCVVQESAITLEAPASYVLVGFPYVSEIETLDLAPRAAQGSGRGKLKRIAGVDLDLYQSSGGEIGRGMFDPITIRKTTDVMDEGSPLETKIHRLNFPGDWRKEARVTTRQTAPLPFTVRSLTARIEVTD